MDYLLIISGFFVGFVIGMTGVGGGSLMTPILVLGFSIQPVIAVGTDLLYAAITKSGGIIAHHIKRNIQWQTVFLLLIGSIPASICCLLIIKRLHHSGFNYDDFIITTLSTALILTAILILLQNSLKRFSSNEKIIAIKVLHQKIQKPATIFAGVMIGILVTISSVGAGVIGAAFLFFVYPKYKAVQVVATDIAHAVPVTAIAGLGHAHIGTVDYTLLLNLLIGSLPGIYLGSHFATFLPERWMRPLLASILLIIGLCLLF